MRPNLESLRQETDRLFNEATSLKVQWAHLEQAQSDEFKVRLPLVLTSPRSCTDGMIDVDSRNSHRQLNLRD